MSFEKRGPDQIRRDVAVCADVHSSVKSGYLLPRKPLTEMRLSLASDKGLRMLPTDHQV